VFVCVCVCVCVWRAQLSRRSNTSTCLSTTSLHPFPPPPPPLPLPPPLSLLRHRSFSLPPSCPVILLSKLGGGGGCWRHYLCLLINHCLGAHRSNVAHLRTNSLTDPQHCPSDCALLTARARCVCVCSHVFRYFANVLRSSCTRNPEEVDGSSPWPVLISPVLLNGG